MSDDLTTLQMAEVLRRKLREKRDCGEGRPTSKIDCPHLGTAIGETTLYGCGCGSQKTNGIPATVFGCGLHGRCVMLRKGTHLADESIVRCVVCPDNPANQGGD